MTAAYICQGIRTPIGRYGGALASVRPDNLAAIAIKRVLQMQPGIDLHAIDDVILGCANQAGEDNRNVARMAALLAELPVRVPGVTLNRLCGSGLDAVATAARAIAADEADLIIAGGVESMSRAPLVMPKAESAFSRQTAVFDTTIGWRFINAKMQQQYGVDSMPETAENVAQEFTISRDDQDAFAYRSQLRAQTAIEKGRFKTEIVPVEVPQRKAESIIVTQDEHPRATTLQKLAALATPFRADGTVTAGNASGVNDGACALLVASEKAVQQHGLSPLARVVKTAVVGVEPRVMGIGPAPATELVLQRSGLHLNDIGVIELNEAFAAQALAVLRKLNIDDDAEHVNPNGGAIALGHPLGMSGARLILTAVHELACKQERYALCTMCIGVGQGIAMILERT